jgi:signal transduction histidine kinase
LGLYICSEIIQNHHGKIYAESEVDKGTAIHILLPRAKPAQLNQEELP